MYVDYQFYTEEYCASKTPVVNETEFYHYERQAEAVIREMTLDRAATYTGGDEVKMATCAALERMYMATAESADAPPPGITSERVGEYSVSYASATYAERLNTVTDAGKTAAWVWLAPTGLLYRGQ